MRVVVGGAIGNWRVPDQKTAEGNDPETVRVLFRMLWRLGVSFHVCVLEPECWCPWMLPQVLNFCSGVGCCPEFSPVVETLVPSVAAVHSLRSETWVLVLLGAGVPLDASRICCQTMRGQNFFSIWG